MSQLSQAQINNLSNWNPEGVEYTMVMSDLALSSGQKIAPKSKAVSILEQINIGLNRMFGAGDKNANGQNVPEAAAQERKANMTPWIIGGVAVGVGALLLAK